jgi:hypothetical protein
VAIHFEANKEKQLPVYDPSQVLLIWTGEQCPPVVGVCWLAPGRSRYARTDPMNDIATVHDLKAGGKLLARSLECP